MAYENAIKSLSQTYNLYPQYRKNAKRAPATGDAETYDAHLLRLLEKTEQKRAYKSLMFKGTVLYSSTITKEEFEKMYDSAFYSWVYQMSDARNGKVKSITQSIVYCLELCVCLPQIKNSDFLSKINEAKTGKEDERVETRYAAAIKEAKSQLFTAGSIEMRDLKILERYPKIYSANDKKPSYKDFVTISFRNRADFSYGVLIPGS